MKAIDIILQVIIYGGFGAFAYTKIKGQTFADTIQEIRDFIDKFKEK